MPGDWPKWVVREIKSVYFMVYSFGVFNPLDKIWNPTGSEFPPTNNISMMWWSCNVPSHFVVSSPLLLIYSNQGFQISHHSTGFFFPCPATPRAKGITPEVMASKPRKPMTYVMREWGTVPVWATLKYGQPLVCFLPWNPCSRSYHTNAYTYDSYDTIQYQIASYTIKKYSIMLYSIL